MSSGHWKYSCAGLALLMLAACGGGGGTGSIVMPVPSVTPTPSPLPSPAPTPAAEFNAGIGAAMIGTVLFDINNNGVLGDSNPPSDVIATTNRNGQFGRDAVGRLSSPLPPAVANYTFEGGGIDASTGYLYTSLRAPAGATTLSPITTLLRSIDDDTLAANIGLGLNAREIAAFAAVPAMSSTDAVTAARGRRGTAFNLKLIAFAAFGSASQAVIVDGSIQFKDRMAAIVERLDAGPIDLNDEAAIRAILDRSSRALNTSAEGRAAVAQLLSRFGAAVDTYLTGPERVAAIQHGLRLIILPELADIFRGNVPDTSVARSITTEALLNAFADFAAIPAPTISAPADGSGNLLAVTDFRSIGRHQINDTLTLEAQCIGDMSLFCNDVGIGSGVGVDVYALTVAAVRVPAQFADRFDAVLAADHNIVMRRLNKATGLIWFEYDVLAKSGKRATGRAYVRLGGIS